MNASLQIQYPVGDIRQTWGTEPLPLFKMSKKYRLILLRLRLLSTRKGIVKDFFAGSFLTPHNLNIITVTVRANIALGDWILCPSFVSFISTVVLVGRFIVPSATGNSRFSAFKF
jgi:hypothetical protein